MPQIAEAWLAELGLRPVEQAGPRAMRWIFAVNYLQVVQKNIRPLADLQTYTAIPCHESSLHSASIVPLRRETAGGHTSPIPSSIIEPPQLQVHDSARVV
jgi:hypothetical protein